VTAIEKLKLEKAHLQSLVTNMLGQAQRKGATAAEASVGVEVGFSVSVRLGEVETIEHSHEKGLALTVYVGKRTGSASTTDMSQIAVQETVEKAISIAKYGGEDPCSGLAEKELLAFDYPRLGLHYPWRLSIEEAVATTKALEAGAREVDSRITNSEGASLSTGESYHVFGNSLGFLGEYPTSRHNLSCVLIAEENGQMERDYDYTSARDSQDLDQIDALAKRAAMRTVNRLGARRLPTQKCPVVFDARIAKGLMGNFISAISGGNLYRKSSFLVDHLGKAVFPDHVHIYERPHLAKGLGSAPFDGDGVGTKDKDFVKEGMLQSYVLSSYSARKLGMQSTGNAGGVFNLFINHTDNDLEGLLQQMGTGLLVTDVMGQGINIVTGDYSRGVFGYWVENGCIQYPVHEITVAGNLRDMFLNLVAVANDVDKTGNIHSGSILIESMTIGGE